MPRPVPSTPALSTTIEVRPPFRLDCTVTALRRLPQNLVDVFDGGRYLRAFETEKGPVVWAITQEGPSLHLSLHGPVRDMAPYEKLVTRMLGTSTDLSPFYEAAAEVPPFSQLVDRFMGLKPPRYSSLWEALVNAIPFQQLSLQSAMAVVGRIVQAASDPVAFDDKILYPLPSPKALLHLGEAALSKMGLSRAKGRSLRDAAAAIWSGELKEDPLENLGTEELSLKLQTLRGVGPWSASLIMLRGFRRLEVFPANDTGVARGLKRVLPSAEPSVLLEALGPYRGMLYYHLLLAR